MGEHQTVRGLKKLQNIFFFKKSGCNLLGGTRTEPVGTFAGWFWFQSPVEKQGTQTHWHTEKTFPQLESE